jgi:penicillin amidase
VDSLYLLWKKTAGIVPAEKPDKDNGSNNWAVGGSKTASGRPILCNDPHLGLNLPSLWFEIQLAKPGSNVYGASFPGSPAVIIGFNDSCAWGVTNASRDVKDYYSIQFKDNNKQEYWFNGEWKPAVLEVDTFRIKGGSPLYDTVAYTVFGPVQYDATYTDTNRTRRPVSLAVRWKAHDPSNELKTFYLLNKANNYNEYVDAIKHFTCPGQNFVFASKSNEIAIWQQGQFPVKWKRQGDFVMPGTDSSYRWQDTIPQDQNPHVLNPISGFVSSANQMPTDTTYPYYLGGSFDVFRGYIINRKLRGMKSITPQDMQGLQTSNYNVFAEMAVPILLKNVNMDALTTDEEKYISVLHSWAGFKNDPGEKGPAVLVTWFSKLQEAVWNDEMAQVQAPYVVPEEATLLDLLRKDSVGDAFIDNINTPEIETKQQVVTAAFKKAIPELVKADQDGMLEWRKFKNTGIRHLLRLAPFNRMGLNIGGGEYIINATKRYHGPSWRMVVHLADKTEAYAVYPGGQNGNPGSKYYDSFVDSWAAGKYYTVWMMEAAEANDSRVKWKMTLAGNKK